MLDCHVTGELGTGAGSYIIEWKKDGLGSVYVQYNGYPANIHLQFTGRVQLVNGVSLEISHIRAEDEGWYECRYVVVGDGSDNPPVNGTWIYLDVYSKYF